MIHLKTSYCRMTIWVLQIHEVLKLLMTIWVLQIQILQFKKTDWYVNTGYCTGKYLYNIHIQEFWAWFTARYLKWLPILFKIQHAQSYLTTLSYNGFNITLKLPQECKTFTICMMTWSEIILSYGCIFRNMETFFILIHLS